MIYHIIVNPVAGRKKKQTKLSFFQEYILKNDLHGKIYFSKDFQDPKRIASRIEEENPEGGVIVVCGGDGTLNETLNGIKDLSKWSFGILPMGSGNDFATKLNLPKKNLKDCFDLILTSPPKKLDYIKVNNMVCMNITGTGVDIDILERFEKYTKLRGSFRYLVATLVSLFKYKGGRFVAKIDDKIEIRDNPFIMAICNGSQFGGGIKICPTSIVDDGKMNFVYCKNIKKILIPPKLVKLLNGKIHKTKPSFYKNILCNKVTIEREDKQEFSVELDGAIVRDTSFTFELVPGGIKFFC